MFISIVRDLGGQRAIEGQATGSAPVRGVARLYSRVVAEAVAAASVLSLSQLSAKGLAVSICDQLALLIVDGDEHGETTLSDEEAGLNKLQWRDILEHTIAYHMRSQPGATLVSSGREPPRLLYSKQGEGVQAVVVYPYAIGIAQTLACQVGQVGYLVDANGLSFCAFAVNRDLGGRALQYALGHFDNLTVYRHNDDRMLTRIGVLQGTGRIAFEPDFC